MLIIRRALETDIPQIAAIYDRIHTAEETGQAVIGWVRGVYPTEASARAALTAGDLFVMAEDDVIVAAARINQIQVPEYADCTWEYNDVPEDQIMVLHMLTVDPLQRGKGYGTIFVKYYEDYARRRDCLYLRMDTNVKNAAARRLYAYLGYKEPGIVSCVFNGIPGVQLICLEKKLVNLLPLC